MRLGVDRRSAGRSPPRAAGRPAGSVRRRPRRWTTATLALAATALTRSRRTRSWRKQSWCCGRRFSCRCPVVGGAVVGGSVVGGSVGCSTLALSGWRHEIGINHRGEGRAVVREVRINPLGDDGGRIDDRAAVGSAASTSRVTDRLPLPPTGTSPTAQLQVATVHRSARRSPADPAPTDRPAAHRRRRRRARRTDRRCGS